jgi:hypothetical protein
LLYGLYQGLLMIGGGRHGRFPGWISIDAAGAKLATLLPGAEVATESDGRFARNGSGTIVAAALATQEVR